MKLRYSVNQGECFRVGLDCPNSIHLLDVDPAALPQDQRDLIADRLNGINVCKLGVWDSGQEPDVIVQKDTEGDAILLEAKLPGLDHLIEAARRNAVEIQKGLSKANGATPNPYS